MYETNMKKNLQKTSYSMLNSLVNAMFTIFNDKKNQVFLYASKFSRIQIHLQYYVDIPIALKLANLKEH